MLGRARLVAIAIAIPLVLAVPTKVDKASGIKLNDCFASECITFVGCECCDPQMGCRRDKCPAGGNFCCGF